MYGKLIDNKLQYAPINFKLNDGRVIVGFNNSVEAMKQYGYKEVVDNIPKYNHETHYITISGYIEEIEKIIVKYSIKENPSQPPTMHEKIENIENINNAQDELINITMLATDEMFMMIEPLIAQSQIELNTKGKNKMVDMYVAMIIRGLKTIEEVPSRYREEVKRILTQLEK